MTQLLIRLFVEKRGERGEAARREACGLLCGWVGIASNTLLFAVKLLTGLFTGSIAIMADAVNNLSDSASSLLTVIAFKLSSMPADEEHPWGHARFEYISALAVSCLVFVIGVQFLISSVKKILVPAPVLYTHTVALLLLLSIGLKLWQSLFYRSVGRRIASQALLAASADSRNDVISTAAVLLSNLLAHYTGLIALDGWMGLCVAIFIIWSGISMLREALSTLLGNAPDKALVEEISQKILAYPSVYGMHDLIVHDYGPLRRFASVHVEIPASQDIMLSHEIIDDIERDFMRDMNIQMVIHLDPVITNDPKVELMRSRVTHIAAEIDPALSIHDFRLVEGPSHTNLIFDVTVPPRFPVTDRALRGLFAQKISGIDRRCFAVVTIDRSYISS